MERNKKDIQTRIDLIVKQLQERYCLLNIYKQREILTNLNMRLQIKLALFRSQKPFDSYQQNQFLQAISKVPFMQRMTKAGKKQQYICLKYKNLNKTVVVTGLNKQQLQQLLHSYNQFVKKQKEYKGSNIKYRTVGFNEFWAIIENQIEYGAYNMKKYLRVKKNDGNEDLQFKNIHFVRPVRIIRLGQNLLQTIISLSSQHRYIQFSNSLNSRNCTGNTSTRISYRLLFNNNGLDQSCQQRTQCHVYAGKKSNIDKKQRITPVKINKQVEFIDFYAEGQIKKEQMIKNNDQQICLQQKQQASETTSSIGSQFSSSKLMDAQVDDDE